MLVEIPLQFYYDEGEKVDWEALGIEKPDGHNHGTLREESVFINPDIVNYIEPKITEDGCYVNIGEGVNWASALSVQDIAKRINEALS